jgi:serine/threonine protein kinase
MVLPPPGVEVRLVHYPPTAKSVINGGYSVLYEDPSRPNQLCKVPCPWEQYEEAHRVERRIFQQLGEHPNLVKVIEMDEYGIWLERAANGCLTEYYINGGKADVAQKLKWSEDVARVTHFLHEKDVRQADLGGKNLLIDAHMRIILCDFSGSYINGEKATIVPAAGYRHPDKNERALPSIRAEIHALGSTIYEIITGHGPYHGLVSEAIDKLLEEGNYPEVSNILLGGVVQRCWNGDYSSALEVAEEIAEWKDAGGGEAAAGKLFNTSIKSSHYSSGPHSPCIFDHSYSLQQESALLFASHRRKRRLMGHFDISPESALLLSYGEALRYSPRP